MNNEEKRAALFAFAQAQAPQERRATLDRARAASVDEFILLAARKDWQHIPQVLAAMRWDYLRAPQEDGTDLEAHVHYNFSLDIFEQAWLNLDNDKPLPQYDILFERKIQEREDLRSFIAAQQEASNQHHEDVIQRQAQLLADQGLRADAEEAAIVQHAEELAAIRASLVLPDVPAPEGDAHPLVNRRVE